MNLRLLTAVFLALAVTSVYAQEFDCDVTIDAQQLTTEARKNLEEEFVPQLKQYINSYRWTKEGVGTEKIKCTIKILFQGMPRANHYVAQAFIGSLRPIFKTDRNTAVLRILDDNWEFDYVRFQPLTHNDFGFDPFLSFVDFYMYMILGYDFDTFGPLEGTEYFQKAVDIVGRAHGSALAGKGWDISGQSTYQRPLLVDELLNVKFRGLREAVYRYHYKGLDLLHKDPAKARQNMLAALEKIGKLIEKINQRSQTSRVFFDSKYLEIATTFLDDPDRSVFLKLARIDQAHQSTYDEYRQK
jgi:hypothetical protein